MSKKNKKTKNKPLRNPNGFGSVYKLSGRRRRPWVAVVTTGWTENGKQVRQPIGYFATKQEGMDALALHRISPVSPKTDITLGELYADWSAIKYKNISKSTENNYRAAWKHLQRLEAAKAKEIKTSHWQAIIDDLASQDLSQSTLHKVRTLAVMLSDHAMKDDVINKNYAAMVEMPKFEKAKKERFTSFEVKKIEDAATKNIPWVDTILIMIYTGFRISEMLGITRFNVDLDRQLVVGGAKTEAGKDRIVPIHPKILKHIRTWYRKGGEALICRENGKKMSANYYRRNYYYHALDAAGVRRLVPHACRHTFGSMAAEAGVDPLYIQKLIGHTDYAFTANEYTHPEIEALRKAIDKL